MDTDEWTWRWKVPYWRPMLQTWVVTPALVVMLLMVSGCKGERAAPLAFHLELHGSVPAEDAFVVGIGEADVPGGQPELIFLCGGDAPKPVPCRGGATYIETAKATRWANISYTFYRYHRGETAEAFKSGTSPNIVGTTVTVRYTYPAEDSP